MTETCVITCPFCGFAKEEYMPSVAPEMTYRCTKCSKEMKAKSCEHCVYCSYSDRMCLIQQMRGECCSE